MQLRQDLARICGCRYVWSCSWAAVLGVFNYYKGKKKPVLKTIVRAFYFFLYWVFYLIVITWGGGYKAYTFLFRLINQKIFCYKNAPRQQVGAFFLVFWIVKLFNGVLDISATVRVAP